MTRSLFQNFIAHTVVELNNHKWSCKSKFQEHTSLEPHSVNKQESASGWKLRRAQISFFHLAIHNFQESNSTTSRCCFLKAYSRQNPQETIKMEDSQESPYDISIIPPPSQFEDGSCDEILSMWSSSSLSSSYPGNEAVSCSSKVNSQQS